eukprot:6009233-Amphidinium_carterae.2
MATEGDIFVGDAISMATSAPVAADEYDFLDACLRQFEQQGSKSLQTFGDNVDFRVREIFLRLQVFRYGMPFLQDLAGKLLVSIV